MLILLNIKSCVVIPPERNCVLKSLETVQIYAFVGASSHSGVSIGQELILVRLEGSPGLICTLLEDYDHERAHKEGSVGLFGVIKRSVVVNLVALVLRVVHKFFELLAEQMDLAKVEWTEVREKGLIDQVVIDTEVEGMLPGLGRGLITDPVQTLAYDFNWLVVGCFALLLIRLHFYYF